MANASGRRDDEVTFAAGARPWRKRAWLAAAFALIAAAFGLALTLRSASDRAGLEAAPPEVRTQAPAQAPSTATREPHSVSAAPPRNPQPERGAGDAPQQLGDELGPEPVVPSGIGLYPPPGTDPTKIGIVVPEDFPLPEGYLRHYQVTDDGQSMPAILMFHPDYVLLDERGAPVPLPADRVVPPGLAPPGLPIEMLVPPAPRVEEGAP
jgi:hypothetical protein